MKTFLIALVIGALSAFAFAPVGLWPLMLLAIAALCELVWRSKSLKHALAIGWGFGLGQFVVALNWIATAFTFQAAMPAWLGWVAVVLLSLYLAVYPALATGIAWRFGHQHRFLVMLLLAGAWPITEWLRGTIFTGFPWNPLGVTLVDTPFLDWAQFVGTYGLSFFTAFLGGTIWLTAHRHKAARNALIGFAALLGIMYALPAGVERTSGRAIRVVQPNIGQEDKWRPGFAEESDRRLVGESLKPGGERPRLLLWPEAAVTNPLQDELIVDRAFAELERQNVSATVGPGEYLLTGGIGIYSKDGHRISGATNSVFVLGQGGRLVDRFDKAHLTPYGEYLPMRPLLSKIGLSRLAPGDVDFTPGPGPRTLALPGWGKIGLQICYEIIFSGQVVDRRNRPDFSFNPSNDAWFGRWGPPQHLAQARLRAAEEGIPVVRSTPTGISAVVDANGRIVKALPWRTAGVIDARLPIAHAPTLFAGYGNVIPLLLAFLLVASGIVLGRARR
jgi:apolipoprotein N-acyltransferase